MKTLACVITIGLLDLAAWIIAVLPICLAVLVSPAWLWLYAVYFLAAFLFIYAICAKKKTGAEK